MNYKISLWFLRSKPKHFALTQVCSIWIRSYFCVNNSLVSGLCEILPDNISIRCNTAKQSGTKLKNNSFLR